MKRTKEGKRFILAAFLIAVAAFNTGNNLIYLILSLMLSFILLSNILLRINLSGLSLEVHITPPVFAGEKTQATFLLSNNKRFLPSYSMNVLTPGAAAPAYFISVPPRSTGSRKINITFQKRGLYRHGDFHIQSGFPFILRSRNISMKVSGEVLVYPALMALDHIISQTAGREDQGAMIMLGRGEEIYSIRKFRYGDDWRKIHWKASAKVSDLLVKEYEERETRKVTIILDNLMPADSGLFEKAVSITASLSKHFLDSEYLVRVLSCRKVIPFGGGEEHLYKVLDILAVINEEDLLDCPVSYDMEGYFILVLKSRNSPFAKYISSSDMVIYADTV